MLNEREIESCYLGQFIPVHYHHNMLMDANRMQAFKAAIDQVVFSGAKVLELGGGTGVLSWFASARAEKIWCVEYNPDLVREARRFLQQNKNGEKVEVVHADAFEYLPPEPVDIVICEMIHVAMLREKQVEVIESFKRRYLERFGGPLPRFMPEAMIMAVQPLQQEYDFEGFHAPIVQFQEALPNIQGSVELAAPSIYTVLDFSQPTATEIAWEGVFTMERGGTLNALRFISKNILAILMQQSSTIDWFNHYMALPLATPVKVSAGDRLQVKFKYRAGGSIPSLQGAIEVALLDESGQTAVSRQHAYA